jgi:hypothetical protein
VKLEGAISTFPLRELIDMIVYSSVTGVLNIYAADLSGHIYFRDGNLYHVDADAAEGVDALALLLERPQANFAFVSDPTIERETVWGDHEQHVRMAEHIAARWGQVRPYIPHLQLIPVLLVPHAQLQPMVNPAHLPLLELIDGRQTLIDLAHTLNWPPIEVAEATVQLIENRQAELRSDASVANETCERQATPASNGGLFDRVRHQVGVIRRTDAASPAAPAADELALRGLRG